VGEQKIVLPPDSVGKAVHTRERTVSGPGVVQEPYVIPISARVASGVYLAHTGVHVVQAAATNGTSTGFWWLYNPVGSAVLVALRSVNLSSQIGSALLTATSPRLLLQAFTFTGTPAGTNIAPRKALSSYATATASIRTTQVTSVVTLTQSVLAWLTYANETAVGGNAPSGLTYAPKEDEQPVLAAGEGLVLYQPDAGTTSDTRRFVTNVAWAEFTVP
jgi:hypothetical protein